MNATTKSLAQLHFFVQNDPWLAICSPSPPLYVAVDPGSISFMGKTHGFPVEMMPW